MAELRRQHRIRAQLTGAMPEVPPALRDQLRVTELSGGTVQIETPGELAPLLGWLATLPLTEILIEPVRLQAVYDEFHPAVGVDHSSMKSAERLEAAQR